MDRDQSASENLLDQENKLIAEILAGFRAIIRAGTDRVDNTASTGQAAFNTMAMEIHMNGLIKSTEDLLGLTRQLRELWVVGPLKKPGEGDDEAQQVIKDDASQYFATLNGMRRAERLKETADQHGSMQYREGPLQGNPMTPSMQMAGRP
ncbi:hypothetical protein B0T16DRAFT_337443 [Cercophora newfieldiana]|uniref:Uncharacterized protein n=1 Tax=Cercophora newfieldiana TaxID=92897 RepID=A0AA39XT32_9PEZI|nr:hypothetical protein B0T16DRAFT_337443 [Cercophora newfieldiana]